MERCRHCGSERIIKTGHRDGQQKWRCKEGRDSNFRNGQALYLHKKNRIKSEYGLLSIGTRSVLLHLKSETQAGKL